MEKQELKQSMSYTAAIAQVLKELKFPADKSSSSSSYFFSESESDSDFDNIFTYHLILRVLS